MLNWTPKPTRSTLQTLTDRAGGVGQRNTPLFSIKRFSSKKISDSPPLPTAFPVHFFSRPFDVGGAHWMRNSAPPLAPWPGGGIAHIR